MKIESARFVTSAAELAGCPRTDLPEFAFIGRSNVGKSSLINLLTGRKDLAKVSATPGKTVLLNFFEINHSWMVVDLPGYGFAQASRKARGGFNRAVDDYIELREQLCCVFVLVDSRLEPQPIDLQFIEWLENLSMRYALVFTKTDKQAMHHTQKAIAAFTAKIMSRRAEPPETFMSSTKTQSGRSEIFAAMQRIAAEPG